MSTPGLSFRDLIERLVRLLTWAMVGVILTSTLVTFDASMRIKTLRENIQILVTLRKALSEDYRFQGPVAPGQTAGRTRPVPGNIPDET